MVGGQATLDLVKSLSWNGRIILEGFTSGSIPEIPVNRLLLKNAKADGLYKRMNIENQKRLKMTLKF